eukprot:3338475-Prymnesium_polylepis.2
MAADKLKYRCARCTNPHFLSCGKCPFQWNGKVFTDRCRFYHNDEEQQKMLSKADVEALVACRRGLECGGGPGAVGLSSCQRMLYARLVPWSAMWVRPFRRRMRRYGSSRQGRKMTIGPSSQLQSALKTRDDLSEPPFRKGRGDCAQPERAPSGRGHTVAEPEAVAPVRM